jgi:FKBP-type peptidyl-prolyl cis-trans isomerase SlyD
MSTASATVATGTVVSIHYTLKNDGGETLDSSSGAEPFEYLHGSGMIVPGLEDALFGKQVGERLAVVVPAEQGYGERDLRGVQRVPRSAFPMEGEIEAEMMFQFEGPDGEPIGARVISVEDGVVVIDLNHPLAGETLHFDVSIEAVRNATAEELAHGHPHGAHGHHHH